VQAELDFRNFFGYPVSFIVKEIRHAQRKVNYLNWGGAQQSFLFYTANQDPEKPGKKLSPIDFLPFPDAMADEGNKVVNKLSSKTKAELDRIIHSPGTLNPQMHLQIYSVLYDS
jgi:hypothetical protein